MTEDEIMEMLDKIDPNESDLECDDEGNEDMTTANDNNTTSSDDSITDDEDIVPVNSTTQLRQEYDRWRHKNE